MAARRRLLAAIAAAALATNVRGAEPCRVRVHDVEGEPSVLLLPDGRRFPTTLFGAECVGELPSPGREPYLLLAGITCRECDAPLGVYVHSVSDGPMPDEATLPGYPYPGSVRDALSGDPLERARLFVGDCLDATDPPQAVWFFDYLDAEGHLHEHVVVLDVTGGKLRRRDDPSPRPALDHVTARAAAGRCREVPGEDRPAAP